MHAYVYLPPSFWEHDLMLCYLGSMFNMVCLVVLEGLQPYPLCSV